MSQAPGIFKIWTSIWTSYDSSHFQSTNFCFTLESDKRLMKEEVEKIISQPVFSSSHPNGGGGFFYPDTGDKEPTKSRKWNHAHLRDFFLYSASFTPPSSSASCPDWKLNLIFWPDGKPVNPWCNRIILRLPRIIYHMKKLSFFRKKSRNFLTSPHRENCPKKVDTTILPSRHKQRWTVPWKGGGGLSEALFV